jgi:hypothetical protein
MADFETSMKIICLESQAFKALVSEVTTQIKQEFSSSLDPWISEDEAKNLLRIDSKTTLHKYRTDGKIDYRKVSAKQTIYRRQSILDFIEKSPK